MEEIKKNHNPDDFIGSEKDDVEDLDRFIEKRKIQNEALKKIAGMEPEPDDTFLNEPLEK